MSVNFAITFVLAEFNRIWQNLIKLVELSRIHLLSILLRYFYCNWASFIILPPPLAGGLNNSILVKTLLLIIFHIFTSGDNIISY